MTVEFDPSALTTRAYDERIAALEQRLERELEAYRRTDAELAWWRKGRELFAAGAQGDDDAAPSAALNGSPPSLDESKPVLREAILQIMREDSQKTWKAPQLIRTLTERGWMPNGKNAEHIVRSRLSTMTKAEDLDRVGYGEYALREAGDQL